ncbi:Hypothetical protein DHA2_89828 [Giardia duodenalis]|uniref:Cilia- and flagella-associated protein 91 n=1 Tax=Giardia intestinalis TaxID=5741 RepID=V6TRQ4_GIAIN|nr:Hypothetical protein DHA2_89828 [Giardia intestinalis]
MWSFQDESGPITQVQTVSSNAYYRRPMIPRVEQVSSRGIAFTGTDLPRAPPDVHRTVKQRAEVIGISVAIQTDFREIEIQTDPWTAPLEEDACGTSNQEVKSLLELTVANGLLPAHEETMKVIERIKRLQDFDAAIPAPLDPTRTTYTYEELRNEQKRISMLVERDLAEWKRKEAEMKKVQDLRLELLIQKLMEREEARTEIRIHKLERMRNTHEMKASAQLDKLSSQRLMTLKKQAHSRDATIQRMVRRMESHNFSNRSVIDTAKRGPRLALPETISTSTVVNGTIHSANILNAPFLKPGEAPYRYTGVIKLAGTDLRTQESFDEILQFMPEENRLILGAPLNHTRSAQSARLYNGEGYTRRQRGAKKSRAVTSDDPIPQLLPPPGMTKGEFEMYLNHTQRRFARTGVEVGQYLMGRGGTKEDIKEGQGQPGDDGAEAHQAAESNAATAAMSTSGPASSAQPQEGDTAQQAARDIGKQTQALHFQDPPTIDNIRLADAALFIQNLIRGAAAQVRLYNGKERRLGLVRELRLAHELVAARNEDELLSDATQDRITALKSALATGSISSAVTGIIGTTLDALAKERTRKEQINRARAILEVATRERYRREKEESIRRENVNFERTKSNFAQMQIMEAHRDIADGLLTRISRRAIDADAAVRSKELAIRQVEALVALDYENSKQYMKNPEKCIRDLMASFLLPEIDRRVLISRLKQDQESVGLAINIVRDATADPGFGTQPAETNTALIK